MNIALTTYLRNFSKTQIPLIGECEPSVVEWTEESCTVLIPLIEKTKNHMNCMYFAVYAIGADCACGLPAIRAIEERGNKVAVLFKAFEAKFVHRAESDVYFTCNDCKAITDTIDQCMQTDQRLELPVNITANVKKGGKTVKVGEFVLTLTLKGK